MKKIIGLGILFLAFACINVSCNKEMNINSGRIKIVMTDAVQANIYEHVYIDLKQVSINYDEAKPDVWMDLPTNTGIYDLMELTNNVTTVITSETSIPIGKVYQIRLILGDNNSVVINGDSHFLKLPSAYSSGIKVKVNEEISRNENLLVLLDFNADKSIHKDGGDTYIMNPVIDVKNISNY